MEVNHENRFRSLDFMNLVKNNKFFILTIMVFSVLVSVTFNHYFVSPKYKSESSFIVNNSKDSSMTVTTDQLTSARNLANVYSVIIKSDTILEEVIKSLRLDIDIEELSNAIQVQAVNSTQVVKIVVVTNHALKSKEINEKLLQIALPFIVDTVEAGSVKIISTPKMNENSISASVLTISLIGATIGLLVSLSILVMYRLRNKKINSVEELESYFDLTVIGVIPNSYGVGREK